MGKISKAEREILELLDAGPKKTGDLIVGLGYDPMNFLLTEQIGDGAGDWQQGKHRKILDRLVESGKVKWRRELNGDVVYWRADREVPPTEISGEEVFDWGSMRESTKQCWGHEQKERLYVLDDFCLYEYCIVDDLYGGEALNGKQIGRRGVEEKLGFVKVKDVRCVVRFDADYVVGTGSGTTVKIQIPESDFEQLSLRDLLKGLQVAQKIVEERLRLLWIKENMPVGNESEG